MKIIKIIFLACLCWSIFGLVDIAALYSALYLGDLFSAKSTIGFSVLKIEQDSHFILLALCLYFGVGLCCSILLGLLYCLKIGGREFWEKNLEIVCVGTCLALICVVNNYTVIVAPYLLSFYMKVMAWILFLPLFALFYLGVKNLKIRFSVKLFSTCVSLELFWVFLIYNFGRHHYLIILFAAALVSLAVFFTLNSILSRAIRFRSLALVGFTVCGFFVSVTVLKATDVKKNISDKPNVVMILLDTLRSDHLSSYGYQRRTTKHIDAFSKSAIVYKNAYAAASWTLPSISSIFTGTYPGYHGAHRATEGDGAISRLAEKNITLSEILVQNGYRTAGFVSTYFVSNHVGLGQGFQHFDDGLPSFACAFKSLSLVRFARKFFPVMDYLAFNGYFGNRKSFQINNLAASWLNKVPNDDPFFMFLHYFDSHTPYLPGPLGLSHENVPVKIKRKFGRGGPDYYNLEKSITTAVNQGDESLSQEAYDYLVGNYDSEIVSLDENINLLFNILRERGLFDNSLIVLLSDHGESFGEHNLMLHGLALYEDNLRVPLMIKYPLEDKRKSIIDYPVSLTGLMPTILNYLEIPVPESVQGTSLEDKETQIIISQNYPDVAWKKVPGFQRFNHRLISSVVDGYKYIKVSNGRDMLFNLKEDPAEVQNIIDIEVDLASSLNAQLLERIISLELAGDSGEKVLMDESVIENLKSLGYMQ